MHYFIKREFDVYESLLPEFRVPQFEPIALVWRSVNNSTYTWKIPSVGNGSTRRMSRYCIPYPSQLLPDSRRWFTFEHPERKCLSHLQQTIRFWDQHLKSDWWISYTRRGFNGFNWIATPKCRLIQCLRFMGLPVYDSVLLSRTQTTQRNRR